MACQGNEEEVAKHVIELQIEDVTRIHFKAVLFYEHHEPILLELKTVSQML